MATPPARRRRRGRRYTPPGYFLNSFGRLGAGVVKGLFRLVASPLPLPAQLVQLLVGEIGQVRRKILIYWH